MHNHENIVKILNSRNRSNIQNQSLELNNQNRHLEFYLYAACARHFSNCERLLKFLKGLAMINFLFDWEDLANEYLKNCKQGQVLEQVTQASHKHSFVFQS